MRSPIPSGQVSSFLRGTNLLKRGCLEQAYYFSPEKATILNAHTGKPDHVPCGLFAAVEELTGDGSTAVPAVDTHGSMLSRRMIHLATHGLLNDFNGLGIPGAIALAPMGADNGLPAATDILDLKLNAELVVLSVCDTGRERITGDGVLGLSGPLLPLVYPASLSPSGRSLMPHCIADDNLLPNP